MYWILELILVFLFLLDSHLVESDGQLSVKFVYYSNSRGKGANGHCCDGRSIFCTSQCDHKFLICIDAFNGDDDFNHCAIGKKTSNKIANKNTISFGSSIGDLRNPIVIPFSSWQVPGVKVKVKVMDADSIGSDDFVDDLRQKVVVTPGRNRGQTQMTSATLRHRTSLTVELTAHCDVNWYGDSCNRHCEPANDNRRGHYTCDQNTGGKICRSGWTGGSCTYNINDCASNPCENNGICVDKVNRFTCQCTPGFTGVHCDVDIDDCTVDSCLKGSCIDLVAGFRCDCDHGFIGTLCQEVVDFCKNSTCSEGETCVQTEDGFGCLSLPLTTRTHTSPTFGPEVFTETVLNITGSCNISNPCLNNSTCVEAEKSRESQCICEEGWTGEHCQVPEYIKNSCSPYPCLNNGTCVMSQNAKHYYCQCPPLYTGPHCDTELSVCDVMSQCRNNATCRALPGNIDYFCICPENWMGQFCEVDIEEAITEACAEVQCENNGSCVAGLKLEKLPQDDHVTSTTSIFAADGMTVTSETSQTTGINDELLGNTTRESINDFKISKSEHGKTFVEDYTQVQDTLAYLTEEHTQVQKESTTIMSHLTIDEKAKLYKEADTYVVLDVFCACSEQFTGPFCEVDVFSNRSDVIDEREDYYDSHTDDDDEFVDIEKNFQEYPSALLFKTKLNDKQVHHIVETVQKFLSDHLDVKLSDVDVQYDVRSCLSSDKEKVDALLFDVLIKGTVVSWETVNNAFGKVSKEEVNNMLPVSLYEGETCTPLDGTLEYQRVQQKYWLARNWYIVVIFCILVLAVVLGVGYFMFKRRRQSQKAVISEYPTLVKTEGSTENPEHQPNNTNITSNADYFFENKVYEYEEIPDQK